MYLINIQYNIYHIIQLSGYKSVKLHPTKAKFCIF